VTIVIHTVVDDAGPALYTSPDTSLYT
jgi:hypothetical protein